ncbi:hypothetical protein L4X63_20390 [Geomonas sp. Red32]|uniref:hypothetical protein n=1 Tax=Geomonas sp. Red32 TaxID=2912856 RepID=UPI00202D045F|nr:hypothetical protein [Geomonas sp. Red32]MCM0083945.1 hypothetical protein [Geomonas sp. Red32]
MPSKVPYQKPLRLPDLERLTVDLWRVDLSRKIHSPKNRKSTGAFMDSALCYFAPWLVYEVAVAALPGLDWGSDPAFTHHRRAIVACVVDKLKTVGAIEEALLTSPSHYCGKFRICLGHGYQPSTDQDHWLIPISPAFFWGEEYEGVPPLAQVVQARRLTGLAGLCYVTPLNGKGGIK